MQRLTEALRKDKNPRYVQAKARGGIESEGEEEKDGAHVGKSVHEAGDLLKLSKTSNALKGLINGDQLTPRVICSGTGLS